jgi:cytoskeletal protein RodZ
MNSTLDAIQNVSSPLSPALHLAQKRLAKNISLEDITSSTCINPRYLRAIEIEDFAQLPGGIYAVSYIRQYAAATGCDENDVLARYRSIVGSPDIPDTADPSQVPTDH